MSRNSPPAADPDKEDLAPLLVSGLVFGSIFSPEFPAQSRPWSAQ